MKNFENLESFLLQILNEVRSVSQNQKQLMQLMQKSEEDLLVEKTQSIIENIADQNVSLEQKFGESGLQEKSRGTSFNV